MEEVPVHHTFSVVPAMTRADDPIVRVTLTFRLDFPPDYYRLRRRIWSLPRYITSKFCAERAEAAKMKLFLVVLAAVFAVSRAIISQPLGCNSSTEVCAPKGNHCASLATQRKTVALSCSHHHLSEEEPHSGVPDLLLRQQRERGVL